MTATSPGDVCEFWLMFCSEETDLTTRFMLVPDSWCWVQIEVDSSDQSFHRRLDISGHLPR